MGYLTRRISNLLKANLNDFLGRVLRTKSGEGARLEDLLNEFEREQAGEKRQERSEEQRQQCKAPPGSPLPDYYEILEVHYKASAEVIEKAYKVLATKYHPDKQPYDRRPWAEARMKQINEAYSCLRDPERRREYDQKRGYPEG